MELNLGNDSQEESTRKLIERICIQHGLPRPQKIVAEERGNEKTIYYLDDRLLLAFGPHSDICSCAEALTILEHIEEMPTPRVIAWTKEDPELHAPYMVMERCPGIRLDNLWKTTNLQQRTQFLEDLGTAMGHYHTVNAAKVKEVADRLSLSHRVAIRAEPTRIGVFLGGIARDFRNLLSANEAHASFDWPQLAERLTGLGLQASPTIDLLRAHYAQNPQQPEEHFIGPGLVHGEPWAEHFFMEDSRDCFRLSGCVDLELVTIADSFHEITFPYVSMLALESEYYLAFKRGYECFFAFPADAQERLRYAAVNFDTDAILWLLDQMESRPNAWGDWATPWLAGHWCRLLGWLDPSKKIHRAMFRVDIGPF
jgi:aminoglycoside phosphotransferase (APT) family kinase protein